MHGCDIIGFNMFNVSSIFVMEILVSSTVDKMESENVRVEEMLEKPSPQNVDTTFGQPSLGPPSLLFDHPHLVERSLLPQALLQQL